MKIIPCKCPDWEVGMAWIGGCESMAFVHGSKMPKDVPTFRFCPWCGTKLEIEKKKK